MKKLNTNTLLTLLVGAMVLVSMLQTLQLLGFTSIFSSGISVGTGAAVVKASPSSGGSSVGSGSSLDNLPSMVGGC